MSLEFVGVITFLSLFLFDTSTGSSNFNDVQHGTKPQFVTKTTSSIPYPDGEKGYCNVSDVEGERMFYYFFNKRSDERGPVMLWLTGEPGLTTGIAIFRENGPYEINNEGNLDERKYGWDKIANMIYVDEPIGTGYSFFKEGSKVRNTGDEVVNDLYNFLQEFFKIHYKYKDNTFFIAGQSYAGRYAPMLGEKIHKENENTRSTGRIYIHLKGISIGNGLTSPSVQFGRLPRYCKAKKLIKTAKNRKEVGEATEECKIALMECDSTGKDVDCLEAHVKCLMVFTTVTKLTEKQTETGIKKLNLYDIKEDDEDPNGVLAYNYSDVGRYLNKESVKKALGVEIKPLILLNEWVRVLMCADNIINSEEYVAYLVNRGINVLIYAGDDDLVNNWMGIHRWVINLKWNHRAEFYDKKLEPFALDDDDTNTAVGNIIGVGPLKYCTIFNSGHMTAMNKPEVTFGMMKAWMEDSQRTRTY